jgi:O-antigen/teichoic acid export membrane protein
MLSKLSPTTILAVVTAAVFGRMSTAIAQVVAAFYLTPEQFGIYATAVGVVIVTSLFRGGGTGNHMLTMTPAEFESGGGRFFRYSLIFAALALVASLLVAGPAASAFAKAKGYSESDLRGVIVVLGIQFTVFIVGQYPRSRITAELRFKELAALDVISGILKLATTWVLAVEGGGAMALAVPLLVTSGFENLWTWARARLTGAELHAPPGWFRGTLREMRLPLVMAVLATLNSQTDALVGSVLVPVAVIGYYFFATQLASQPNNLIATSLRSVFAPTAARVRGNVAKERESIYTVFTAGMVFAPIVSMAIPAVFDSFERAVWNGKWAESRIPLLILSATLVYPTVVQLVAAPLSGIRDWSSAIRLDSGRAITKILGAAIAGVLIIWLQLGSVASGILLASVVGGLGAGVASLELYRIIMRMGIATRGTILYELYSTPLAALLSGVASAGLAHSLADSLSTHLTPRTVAYIECAIAGTIYIALSLILLRFGYTRTLERVIELLPPVAGKAARKIFVLPR